MEDTMIRESIELCGKTYLLKPSFRALVEIEKQADISIVKIVSRYGNEDVRWKDFAAILYGCAVGADADFPMSFNEFGELVYSHSREHGMNDLITKAFELVISVLSGDTKKKAENMSQSK